MASLKQPVVLPPEPMKCSSGCCRTSTSLWYKVLKVFLVIAVLMFVFSAGAACVVGGFRSRGMGRGYDRNIMMMKVGNGGMMNGWEEGKKVSSYKRMFGTITKIEGNLITVTDNAAEEQMVLSKQQTIIVVASKEVGLSALKVGENVVVIYSTDDAGQMEAETISVQ